jgi:hypothetical protein
MQGTPDLPGAKEGNYPAFGDPAYPVLPETHSVCRILTRLTILLPNVNLVVERAKCLSSAAI